jgi:leucyl aminopeptidase (aminopeptidase T)
MANLAANLVQRCLRIRPEDNVTIFFYPHTQDLAEDIAVECFRAGADALLNLYTDRYYEAYMRLLTAESLRKPSVFCRGLTELSTAEFLIGGPYDPAIFRKFAPEKMAADAEGETEAHMPALREKKARALFVSLGQVTRPRAKTYGFNFAAWNRMVLEASAVPGDKLSAHGRAIAERLREAGQVRIRAGTGTDLEFSVKGRAARVYDGVIDEQDLVQGAVEDSVPAGAVTIAVEETSANGTIVSDVPTAWAGRTIRRLKWAFRDGTVDSFEGDANAKALKGQWDQATGDKDRIATMTIGVNPKARLGFLSNSIVRGAVTIGIGANELVGGKNASSFGFEQALRDASVELDAEPIVERGRLVGL